MITLKQADEIASNYPVPADEVLYLSMLINDARKGNLFDENTTPFFENEIEAIKKILDMSSKYALSARTILGYIFFTWR